MKMDKYAGMINGYKSLTAATAFTLAFKRANGDVAKAVEGNIRIESADANFNLTGKIHMICYIAAGQTKPTGGDMVEHFFLYAGESMKPIPAGCTELWLYNSHATSAAQVYYEFYSDEDISGSAWA